MKTPDYLSYDRYKTKKKKDKSKNGALIFITTFFVTLLIFTVVAKSLSPNVDVSINDETETDAKESGLGVKKFIDERLKSIQMEDNSAGVSVKDEQKPKYNDAGFDRYSQEQEEKMDIPVSDNNNSYENNTEINNPITLNNNQQRTTNKTSRPPRPSTKDLSTPYVSTKMTKVYVGRYSTVEQAKVAQGILMDSGINITPFIKNVNGSYTLQVGSYSNRAKADDLATELQRNNFPARVVQDN